MGDVIHIRRARGWGKTREAAVRLVPLTGLSLATVQALLIDGWHYGERDGQMCWTKEKK